MDRYIVGKGENIWIEDNYAKIMKTITTQDLQTLLNNQSNKIDELQNQLKSQPKEIIEKIRETAILDVEGYYKITEEELDTILKDYQK